MPRRHGSKPIAPCRSQEYHLGFVEEFGRGDVSAKNLASLRKRKGWKTGRTGQFPKGNISHNKGKKGVCAPGSEKGWFAKGTLGGRAAKIRKPIGYERISRDGYLERKVNDDLPFQRRWKTVHRINWEAVNGPLPSGSALKCLDGNPQNVDAENWKAVPRAMMPRLAGRHTMAFDSAPSELKPSLMAIAELEHAARLTKRAAK
jgi:hypothetical protein